MFARYYRASGTALLFCIVVRVWCSDEEPRHCSKFHYEEKLLEKMVRIEMKMEEMERKMSTEMADIRQEIHTKPQSVAFRAILSKDAGKVTNGHVIVFDQVDLNLGNAYGARHGFFTAPYNGTYIFAMGLGNPAGRPGAFFLRKNGKGVEYVIAGHTTGWNIGGVTTVVELFVGDQVWIEGEGYISGAYPTARYHTSFSGALVRTV